jgi:hypothetical protein
LHFDVDRTLTRLLCNGHEWDGMRKHVREYIRTCQKMRLLKPCIVTHPFVTNTLVPWQRISVDTLPVGSKDSDATTPQWLVVVCDSFTRWTERYSILKPVAEFIATVLLDFFCTYATPTKIQTGGGSECPNAFLEAITTLADIDKIKTEPNSHEENGLIERRNKDYRTG